MWRETYLHWPWEAYTASKHDPRRRFSEEIPKERPQRPVSTYEVQRA